MLAKIGVNAKTLNFSHFTPQARLFFLEKKKANWDGESNQKNYSGALAREARLRSTMGK